MRQLLNIIAPKAAGDATFYTWRKKYRWMAAEDLRRLRQLEA